MSGRSHASTDHDRARELAAASIDGLLDPAEEAWLDEHVARCTPCAAVAADYATDHDLLVGLRDHPPEPPRDLWARTAAAIESEAGHGKPAARRAASRSGSRIGWILAPVAGLAVVAVVVGSGLLNGQAIPSPEPGVALATPMAVTTADVQVLTRDTDGQYRISTRSVNEVCPVGAAPCEVAPSAESAPLAAVPGKSAASEAILSPARDRLVVVQAANGVEDVYVIPVHTALSTAGTPDGTQVPAGTAGVASTPTDRPQPTTLVTPGPLESPGGPGASASPEVPSGTDEPATAAPVTPGPVDTALPTPAATPVGTPVAATEAPSEPAASDAPTIAPSADPLAATESPSPAGATPSPSPSVAVTPGPGGAIRIASNVHVVGNVAAYNKAGTRFAFTARPADGSAGPDVYLWNTDEPTASPVTTDHRSVFGGWHEGHLVVSRVGGTDPGTYLLRQDGSQDGGRVSEGWLPTISPDKASAAWWDGSVRFAKDGVTPVTGNGRLVLGPWEDAGSTQTLAEGPLGGWTVRWDPSGTVLAVWVAGKTDAAPGRLSLYRVNEDGRTIDQQNPLLENEPAFGDFGLDEDHLAWRATGKGASTVVKVMAWQGGDVGIVELPAEAGSSILH